MGPQEGSIDELYVNALLTIEQGQTSIVGFFVSENTVVACRHGINWNKPEKIVLKDWNNNNIIPGGFRQLSMPDEDIIDLCVLELNTYKSPYAVHLNARIKSEDKLFCVGRSKEFSSFDASTFEYVLTVSKDGKHHLMKFKDGFIEKGYSGSPILNYKTNSVCGFVIKSKGKLTGETGGYGISIKSVFECFPNLKRQNALFHLTNSQWFDGNKLRRAGIGRYDKTYQSGHFNIFDHSEIKIRDLYIIPNFTTLPKENPPLDLSISELYKTISNLLSAQNILLIIGNYGAGKTILSKQIQWELAANGEDCVFIDAYDLYTKDEDKIIDLISERLISDSLYLIVDSLDVVLNDLSPDDIINPKLKALLRLSDQYRNIKLIINSRVITKEIEETLYDINVVYQETCRKSLENIIVLDYFKKKEKSEWLENYSFISNRVNFFPSLFEEEFGVELQPASKNLHFFPSLFEEELTAIHKELSRSCENPLLLYLLADSFQNNKFNQLTDIYSVLGSFVDKTIAGKFYYEVKAEKFPVVIPLYKQLLKKIARAINRKMTDFGDEKTFNFIFDDNSRKYEIADREVGSIIGDEKDKILAELNFNKIDGDRLVEKTFNNYFFEFNSGWWKFKDNNVLFYLIAEDYFTELLECERKFENGNYSEDSLKEAYEFLSANLKLSPKIEFVELLIYKCLSLKDDEKEKILFLLDSFFEAGLVLNIKIEQNLTDISLEKIKLDIVLIIIYLQLNKKGYSEIEYFFTRLSWLADAVKTLNKDIKFLIKRFFKKTSIINANIKRLNLSGYNFDFSKLVNTKLIQNSINNARFNNSQFENVNFDLCEIRDSTFEDFSGEIIFTNCYLQKLKFTPKKDNTYKINLKKKDDKNYKITFSRCFIMNLDIVGVDDGTFTDRNITIEIIDSVVSMVTFKRITSKLCWKNSSYDHIKCDAAEIYYEYAPKSKEKLKLESISELQFNEDNNCKITKI